MPVILVVEQDADSAERIRAALRTDGLSVETAASYAEALSRAEKQAPQLLLTSSSLPGASELLAAFSRDRGGPGSIVLVPVSETPRTSAADFSADEMLATPFPSDDLRRLVQRCLRMAAEPQAEARVAPDADSDAEQLTSADIFGEMLAEVEAEVLRTPRAARSVETETPMADIERKLEETLSGVIPTRGRNRRAEAADGKPPEPPNDSEIDALLDETLSSLDIPTRARKPATTPPVPPATTPASPLIGDTPPFVIEEPPPLPVVEDLPRPVMKAAPPAVEAAPARDAPGDSVLDALVSAEDQFRTQPLPALDFRKEATEGEPFGDYTLLERIALGGMAEIWRARRRGVEGFQKDVAIKKILSHLTGSQDFVTMFIDEAKLAAQLTHNNIIQIYDLGKVDNDFFIAMELVDGKDLRSILTAAQESGRPVPIGLALGIVSALARALDYAHRKRDFDDRALGLVHRDVSPQNVLISYEGEIKLCDFGIVKAVAKASTTQMGALKGKLQYMSPEQAWGKTVDARSDIFSLGSVLYEILTGTQLFAGESEIGVLDAVRECRVRSTREIVPEIPEAVDLVVQKALAKTPEKRFQTAADMEQEIRAALDDLGPAPSQKALASYLHSLFNLPPVEGFPPAVVVDAPLAVEEVAVEEVAVEEVAVEEVAVEEVVEPVAAPVVEPVAAPVVEPVTGANGDGLVAADSPLAEGTTPPARGSLKWLVAAIVVGVLIGVSLLVVRSMKDEEPATPALAQPAPAIESPAPAPADATPELPKTAAGIDIEQMVDDELTSRAERLRRDFEAEKKRIEDELAKTREPAPPPPPDDKNTDGDGSDGR